jgi:hypothetical protein
MTGYTPGPWTTPGTDGDARVVCGVNRKHGGRRQTIAHVYSFALPGRANYDAERDANAALIVVAPDMMALLARAVDDRIDNEWLETARAVIAAWATPRAEDAESAGMRHSRGVADTLTAQAGQGATSCPAGTGKRGVLRPGHSRWLMGYPAAWDYCGATAMQSCRKSRRSS